MRSWNGFLLWLTRCESDLVVRLLDASGYALPIAEWLDPAAPDVDQRVVELPGLLSRGVVRTQTRGGDTWLSLNLPAEVTGDRRAGCADCAERMVQADVLGAVLRSRGGRWLMRRDASAPDCQHHGLTPDRRLSPGPSETFHAYSTSWRAGSADATRNALLDLVDVDQGIIAGIRRGSGLPDAVPIWFAGPNRALSTADPSGLTWRIPGNAMGKGLTDDEAQLSALAEAAERWSGTWQRGDGTEDVVGLDLATGESVAVPADRVYMGHPPVDGYVRHTDSNGLAAGVSLVDAQLQAFLEIIERDAITAWWEGETRSAPVAEPLLVDGALAAFVDWLEWLGQEIDVQVLPSIDGTTTVLAVGWLPDTRRWLYGAGTHLDPAIAIRRAVLELVQSTAAALATPKQIAPGQGIPAELYPPSGGSPAFIEMSESPWLSQPSPHRAAVDYLARVLTEQGRRTYAVDVTRPEVGVPVARVVVEGQTGMPLPMR